jgi:hypothetical protein
MKRSEVNQIRARRGAFALMCGTEGQIDQEFLGLAVRNMITDLGHYCDTQDLPFERVIKSALKDWEVQRTASEE